MVDSWLKAAQWLALQLGVPGALIAAVAIYLAYQLRWERERHDETRKQVLQVQDKRLELLQTYLKAMEEFKLQLQALTGKLK